MSKTKTIEIKCKGAGEMALSQLNPSQGKLKILTDERRDSLINEIMLEGFSEPISIWEDPKTAKIYIVNGHQRHAALSFLKDNGWTDEEGTHWKIKIPQIPISLTEADSFDHARRKVLAMASQYGSVSTVGLKSILDDLNIPVEDVSKYFHFPEVNIASITSGIDLPVLIGEAFETNPLISDFSDRQKNVEDSPSVSADADIDAVVSVPDSIKTKIGDIYRLGEHRLMCGDSTNENIVKNLIGTNSIDMVYTDPPYGMSAVQMDGSHFTNGHAGVLEKGKAAVKGAAKRGVYRPVIGDDSITTAVGAFKICHSLKIKMMIFWGANFYASILPDNSGWICWDKENGDGFFADGELAWTNQKKQLRIFRHQWNGMIKASERGQKRVHPTQKPVALAEWCFENYGDPKSVMDLFGGSGSTLIACEKTKRKCFMMELDPGYCDVIIKRWEDFTGEKAEKIGPIKKRSKT